jgi:hypothetical protein
MSRLLDGYLMGRPVHGVRCREDACHGEAFATQLLLDGFLIGTGAAAGGPSVKARACRVQLGNLSIAQPPTVPPLCSIPESFTKAPPQQTLSKQLRQACQ